MLQPKDLKSWAPGIAVAVIFVGFLVAEFVILPAIGPATPVPVEVPAPQAGPAPMASAPVSAPTAAPASAVALPALPPPASADVPSASVWSAYHGAADLCGFVDANFPNQPVQRWQYLAEGAVNQPPVADERGIYLVTAGGKVIALGFDGKERWTRALLRQAADGAETSERVEAPIACFRGRVFVGSQTGVLHALDAEMGTPVWRYDTGGQILTTTGFYAPEETGEPTRVFTIERGDGVLHCINFDTGERLWRTDVIARTDGSAGVANGFVVYGSCDSALHVYTAKEGRPVRAIPLCSDCQFAGGVAIVGDDAYAGNRSGRVIRANVRTGEILWTNQDTTKEVFTTPAVSPDTVVFGADDGTIHALDRATGKQRWRQNLGASAASPIIVGDKAAVSADGALHLLKLDSGETLWSHEISDGISSPALIQGMLVAGSEDGSVTAFGAADSE